VQVTVAVLSLEGALPSNPYMLIGGDPAGGGMVLGWLPEGAAPGDDREHMRLAACQFIKVRDRLF
jgi:hypothetical protein